MKEHFFSKTHRICLEQLQHRANDQITKCMDALNQKRIQSTCRVFTHSVQFGKAKPAIF